MARLNKAVDAVDSKDPSRLCLPVILLLGPGPDHEAALGQGHSAEGERREEASDEHPDKTLMLRRERERAVMMRQCCVVSIAMDGLMLIL